MSGIMMSSHSAKTIYHRTCTAAVALSTTQRSIRASVSFSSSSSSSSAAAAAATALESNIIFRSTSHPATSSLLLLEPPRPLSSLLQQHRSFSSFTTTVHDSVDDSVAEASTTSAVKKLLHSELLLPAAAAVQETTNRSSSSSDGNHLQKQQYTILFLHGLLGNGRNLKTLARNVIVQQQQQQERRSSDAWCHGGILMDLPGHGKSLSFQSNISQQNRPYTFQRCVQDVDFTLQELYRQNIPNESTNDAASAAAAPISVLVGHSWGGRVSLEYAAAAASINNGRQPPLKALWLLDTVPGQAHESVDQVIAAASQIMERREDLDRTELIERLTGTYGLTMDLAQWLASSYNVKTKEFTGFDLSIVQDMRPEFANQDFVGLLRVVLEQKREEHSSKETQVHLVRGGKNTAWSVPVLSELEKLAKEFPKTFHLHVLPAAGHWVHVDDLPGLLALFDKHS